MPNSLHQGPWLLLEMTQNQKKKISHDAENWKQYLLFLSK